MMLHPRWVLALLLALAIAAAFALLGQWQLERAIASGVVVPRTTEKVLPLENVARPDGPTTQSATGQLVSVAGHFVPGDEQLIEDRLNDGVSGYWVVSHFVTEADSASIPVARGWSASEADARAVIQKLSPAATDTTATGETATITGRFLPSEAPEVPAEGKDPHTMTSVSVAALINIWADATDQSVYAGYVVDKTSVPGLTAIDSPAPEAQVTLNWLNIFYAAEWAVFAGFAIFLWYRLVKDAYEREQEEAAVVAADSSSGRCPTGGQVNSAYAP